MFGQAYGKYKVQIIILGALGIFGGFLEGIGVSALVPLLSFAVGEGQGGSNIISETIKSFFSFFNFSFGIKYLLILICILFAFKGIVMIISNYIKMRITAGYEERTRADLLKQTLGADWRYLLKQKVGYLENVLMTDVRQASILLDLFGTTISNVANLLVYLFIAVNISLPITLVTLGLGAFIFLLLKPLIYKSRVYSRKTSALNKEIAHHINENIIGMKTVKSMRVEDKITEVGREQFRELKRIKILTSILRSLGPALVQPASVILVCVVFAIFYKSPNFNFAVLLAIIYLINRIFLYIQTLQTNLQSMGEAAPYLMSILNYTETAFKNKEEDFGKNNFVFKSKLSFNDVNFAYNEDASVLSGVNLEIKKGEMVGLVGPSGSGKTTIVDLILRLFRPVKGKIFLDGQDISSINLKDWRKNIGYISQEIFLKNDSFENNIKFYDQAITDKDMIEAAKDVDIFDLIQKSPEKFKTLVGERGIFLSGGQKQRIALARILARKSQFLILDEATSSLDAESEAHIQKVIEDLKGKITVLVIAHRLETVMACDKLLVLENGVIAEEGSPANLLKDKESYFHKVYNIRN